MKRREFIKFLSATAASAGWAGCTRSEEPLTRSGEPPNIVFLFSDQLSANVLSASGGRNISTPHLDRVAAQGISFRNGLSTCPLCAPYRGMLMTGRYPTHSGVLLNRINVSPQQNPQCLANVFGAAGYDTGFLGKWHLSAGVKAVTQKVDRHGQSMAEYKRKNPHLEFTPPGPDRLGFRHWEAYNYHTDFNHYWFFRDTPERIVAEGYETDVLIDQAIAYMQRRRDSDRPFLLVIASHPPPPPYHPAKCPTGYLERIRKQLHWSPNVPKLPPEEKSKLNFDLRCYYAMAKHLDDGVGRLVAYLDQSGLAERTLFVFTSDHGEMSASHGLFGKMFPYEESVNVPLLMRWPGQIPAGTRSDVLYTPMDHLPTLCSVSGIPIPDMVDGVDLSSVLQGDRVVERDAVLMMSYVAGYSNFRTDKPQPEWRAVRTDRHTYIKWIRGNEALFDNVDDRYQLRNLVDHRRHQAKLNHLRDRLKDLLAEAHDEFLPGTAYADWYDNERNLIRTALGEVPG